jgi:hypothetical protein
MGIFGFIKDFIKNKLAGGPAIIGTANTLARQFLSLRRGLPDAKNKDIYQQIIQERYAILPISQIKLKSLYEKIANDLKFRDFVVWVLNAETDLADTGENFIAKTIKALERELAKYESLPK